VSASHSSLCDTRIVEVAVQAKFNQLNYDRWPIRRKVNRGTPPDCDQMLEKKVLDTVPLNLINSKAYKPICFQGMCMSSGREGVR
jgi:hypothetical protein